MNEKPANLLVVDDTRANLRLLVDILTNHGYQVRPAPNGRLALASVQRELPDLILLDIMMPGMDGYQVCARLKADERTQEIPIIFISALSQILDKVKAFSIGGVDYITKPFQVEEVLARVKTHLALHRLQKSQQDKNEQLEKEIIKREKAEQLLVEYNHTLEQKVQQRTTELAQATQEAQSARLAAEKANQAKSAFLSNVSHELRTPLNAILGFAQLLASTPNLSSAQLEHLGIINQSGQHLLSLINRVIDFAKIDMGEMTLQEENFDLFHLLHEVEHRFHPQANAKGLRWHMTYQPNVPQYVHADHLKLRQVLHHLLNNAVKFTEKGHISLRVRLSQESPASSKKIGVNIIQTSEILKTSEIFAQHPIIEQVTLRFEVEDTGIGIARNELEQIFLAFVQSKEGLQKEDGLGLGLPISRQYVQRMGGEIKASSQLGRGSLFTFELPLKIASACDITDPQTNEQATILDRTPQNDGPPIEPKRLNTALPPELLAELIAATLEADVEQIFNLLDELRPDYPTLADQLMTLADYFKYDEILDLLQDVESS